MQVLLQLKAEESQTVQTVNGMKEIALTYEPVWVLAKCVDPPQQIDQDAAPTLFGGWKLCARLNDHEVGGKRVGNRKEVTAMIPESAMQSQLQKVWQAAKFSIANDPVTWPSWAMRWALELKRP